MPRTVICLVLVARLAGEVVVGGQVDDRGDPVAVPLAELSQPLRTLSSEVTSRSMHSIRGAGAGPPAGRTRPRRSLGRAGRQGGPDQPAAPGDHDGFSRVGHRPLPELRANRRLIRKWGKWCTLRMMHSGTRRVPWLTGAHPAVDC